jgi:hydroxyethylthiazole kinase-like uncharacterized protein yjeF
MKLYGGLAYVTADEMRAIDQEAIADYSLDVLSLMENAGVAVASLAKRMLGGGVAGKRVCCLVGKGNNGGDGLVAARHLHNWGATVDVMLGSRAELGDIAGRQLRTVEKMGIGIHEGWSPSRAELMIDALLGYNARGDPREPVAGLIRAANSSATPILAVDVPSGLDPTSGEPNDPCIAARATLTLALPKSGFLNPNSRRCVGELYLGDVSIPRALYERRSYPIPGFEESSVVRIRLPP